MTCTPMRANTEYSKTQSDHHRRKKKNREEPIVHSLEQKSKRVALKRDLLCLREIDYFFCVHEKKVDGDGLGRTRSGIA